MLDFDVTRVAQLCQGAIEGARSEFRRGRGKRGPGGMGEF